MGIVILEISWWSQAVAQDRPYIYLDLTSLGVSRELRLQLCLFGMFFVSPQVGGLASENVRWAEAVENFRKQERTLCGDVLLTTAFISYLGYFTKHYRLQLLDQTWRPYLNQLEVWSLVSQFSGWKPAVNPSKVAHTVSFFYRGNKFPHLISFFY